MTTMPVRKMSFDFTNDMDLVFVNYDVPQSYMFVGAWMMLPYLEPYLISVMREAMGQVEDPALREDLKRFSAQEGQHFRQHAIANEIVRNRTNISDKLLAMEAELKAEYDSFLADKPLKFNLAYAEAFEAMTTASARTQFELEEFNNMHGPLADLFEWHIMEELEHRTVAYEAYEAIVGSYFYRVRAGMTALRHYFKWVNRFQQVLMEDHAEELATYNDEAQLKAAQARVRTFVKRALPRWLNIFMPWYHPRKLSVPTQFEAARKKYSDRAIAIS